MSGALLSVPVALLSYLIALEIKKYKRHSLAVCEELYALMLHIKLEVSCYLRPLSVLLRDFTSPLLEEDFLPRARTMGLSEALSASRLPISGEERRILSSLFSSLGSGYAADAVRLIDAYAAEFYSSLTVRRADLPREARLVNTLCASAALGLLILMI